MWVDMVQTGVLGLVAFAVAYLIFRLERELRTAARALRAVLDQQAEIHQVIEDAKAERNGKLDRVWERIDALEARQGVGEDIETLVRFKRVIDAMDRALRDGGDP